MHRVVLVCVLGVMAGCGRTVWDHPVKGTGSLQQDLADCRERAGRAMQEGDPHSGNAIPLQAHIDECLQRHGYVKGSGD
jgi:hypothetical protein